MTVTVRSFAKINLGLRIGAAREDGFHELLTVYQTIGLHDVIRVSVGRGKWDRDSVCRSAGAEGRVEYLLSHRRESDAGAAREGARGDRD